MNIYVLFQDMATDIFSLLTNDSGLQFKCLAVTEESEADGNFILTSLISHFLLKLKGSVCLVTLHHSSEHYRNVLAKLGGHNVEKLQESGHLIVIDALSMLTQTDPVIQVKDLFLLLRSKVKLLSGITSKVLLVVDDISDILAAGFTIQLTLSFLQYCNSLKYEIPSISMAILTHRCGEDEEHEVLAAAVSHFSDVYIQVSGLKTGYSNEISGRLIIKYPLKPSCEQYHYKLLDRHVKVFAPGLH